MIQKIKKTVITLSAIIALMAPVAVVTAVPALAATPNVDSSLCEGADKLQIPANAQPTTNCANLEGGSESGRTKLNDLIAKVINIISVIVGIVAVIMIIWGGFKYITSGGSQEKVTSAKNTLLYAIIGLIIVALAQIIVRFVLSRTA